MNKTTLRRAIAKSGFVPIVLACWVVAGFLADSMAQQELDAALRTQQQVSGSAADIMARMIASDLAMSRTIPATIAEMDRVKQALAQSQDYAANRPAMEPDLRAQFLKTPELAAINAFLHDAQGYSGLDNIWLVNAHGLCIASSNALTPDSFVGRDMRSRAYLTNALLGAFAQAYGVDRKSGDPGIFIASPVYADGLLVGVIAAKVGLARLRHWVAHPDTFVADENGVIIMAHDSSLEGHALPHASIARLGAAERRNIYSRTDFPEINVVPLAQQLRRDTPWVRPALAAQLFELPDKHAPAVFVVRGGLDSGLSAHLVDQLTAWPELLRSHLRDHLLAFLILAGTIVLTYVIPTSYLREKRHHRATRDLTEQLQAANTLLSAEVRDDALTGALSRRYFLDLLRREIDGSRASGKALCFAIADLDHFKQINDRFGHATGDRALEHFVDTCRGALRSGDSIGRLGGEEFGILLPATRLADGLAVVERLREQLKARPSPRLPDAAELSVSIGITELSADDLPARIMSRADLALYAAKSAGRDRIEAIPPDDAASAEPAAYVAR